VITFSLPIKRESTEKGKGRGDTQTMDEEEEDVYLGNESLI
jgi:hypothetical protein